MEFEMESSYRRASGIARHSAQARAVVHNCELDVGRLPLFNSLGNTKVGLSEVEEVGDSG
jgi:hypothetical protein